MNVDFKVEFWETVLAETKTLDDMDSWDVGDRTNDMNVLSSIWPSQSNDFLRLGRTRKSLPEKQKYF